MLDKINKFLNYSWLKVIVRDFNNSYPCAIRGKYHDTGFPWHCFFVYDDKAPITGSICFQRASKTGQLVHLQVGVALRLNACWALLR